MQHSVCAAMYLFVEFFEYMLVLLVVMKHAEIRVRVELLGLYNKQLACTAISVANLMSIFLCKYKWFICLCILQLKSEDGSQMSMGCFMKLG
jgi:hypothetical protein